MITKNISIRDDQQEWITENSINLSRFVQKHIDIKLKPDVLKDD